MRILLVEDNIMLGEAILTGLSKSGFTVEWLKDGESALNACKTDLFNLVVLDIGIPKLSGIEVVKKLRAEKNKIPVLILTARNAIEQKVEGLDSGADDYMVKPFDLAELSARIRVLTRRAYGRTEPMLEWKNIKIDPKGRTVIKDNKLVTFGNNELKVLIFLMENINRVISKNRLEEMIYGGDSEVESNTVETIIYKIRKKLNREIIHTIRGIGYVIRT